nr:Rho termination factor N-terminal domain-containing protein [bacterium]
MAENVSNNETATEENGQPGQNGQMPMIEMNIDTLQNMTMAELRKIAKSLKMQGFSTLKKQELIYELIKLEQNTTKEIRG